MAQGSNLPLLEKSLMVSNINNFENDCFAANTKSPLTSTKKLASRSQHSGERRETKAMVLSTFL